MELSDSSTKLENFYYNTRCQVAEESNSF